MKVKMFLNSIFNSPISNWDVSNVQNMKRMFYNSIYNFDISEWDVGEYTNVNQMFDGIKNEYNNDDEHPPFSDSW
jgi:surface protein